METLLGSWDLLESLLTEPIHKTLKVAVLIGSNIVLIACDGQAT